MKAELKPNKRSIALIAAGAAAIVIAVILGLTLGKVAVPEKSDEPSLNASEVFAQAKRSTIRDVRKAAALEGYRDGHSSGTDQGQLAGARVGNYDALVQIQEKKTRRAQSAAARAQAELGAISSPPPTPSVPEESENGPGR